MSNDQLDKWFDEDFQVLTVDRGEGESLGINVDSNVVITEVIEGSVGWNAGLRGGMKITGIDGREITKRESLVEAMNDAGNKFQIYIALEDQHLEDTSEDYSSVMDDASVAESTVSESGQLPTNTITRSASDKDFGFEFNEALLITSVKQSGMAHSLGIDQNHQIILVNNKPSTASELRQIIQSTSLSLTLTTKIKRKETRGDILRRTLKSTTGTGIGFGGIGRKMASVMGNENGNAATTLQEMNRKDGMIITSSQHAERIRQEISSLRRHITDLDSRHKHAIAGSAEFKKRIEQSQSSTNTLTAQHRHYTDVMSKSKTASGRESLHDLVQSAEASQEQQLMEFTTRQAELKKEMRTLKVRNSELHEIAAENSISTTTSVDDSELRGAEKEKQLEDLLTEEKSKIRTAEKDLDSNKKKIVLLRDVTTKTTSEAEEQRENKEFLTKQVKSLKTENSASHEERKQLTLKIQSGAEALEETVEKLMQKVRSAGTDRDKHLAKTSEELTRKQGLENELIKKQQDLEQKLDQTKKTNRSLAKHNELLKADEEKHLSKIEDLDKESHDLREVLSGCEAVEQEKAERLATLEASNTQLSQHELKRESLTHEMANLNKDVKQKSSELAEVTDASQELRNQLSDVEARLLLVYPLSDELVTLQETIRSLTSTREVEDSTVETLHQQLSKQDELFINFKETQQQLKDRIDTHEERVASLHKEADSHTNAMSVLIKNHQAALRSLQDESEIERKDVQQSISLLQSELRSTEKKYKYTGHKLLLLEQSLMKPVSNGDGTISSYSALKAENEKLISAVASVQDRFSKAEADKKTAQATILTKQVEENKKDAMLERYAGTTDPSSSPRRFLNKVTRKKTPSMQHVVEELMFENSKLKQSNKQLRNEIEVNRI